MQFKRFRFEFRFLDLINMGSDKNSGPQMFFGNRSFQFWFQFLVIATELVIWQGGSLMPKMS